MAKIMRGRNQPTPTNQREVLPQLPYRIPAQYSLQIEVHESWLRMLKSAENVINDDIDLQLKASKGLMIKGREVAPEVLGRLYAQYCNLINKMYDVYLNNLQLQRATYIQEIISILMKRMFELRNELVHIIVNDYIFVDSSLKQLLTTPYDIEIIVPYHYAKDSRPGSMEELLQKMWKDAEKKRIRAARPKKKKLKPIDLDVDDDLLGEGNFKAEKVGEKEQVEEEIEDEEEVEEVQTKIEGPSKDFINCVLIQKQERYRKFYLIDFLEKCNKRRIYFAPKDFVPPPPELQNKAANLIQKFYRRCICAKREQVLNYRRDIRLGLVPDVEKTSMSFRKENEKVYERRHNTRTKLKVRYEEETKKQRERLILLKKRDDLQECLVKEITDWFDEWYNGYDFFPQYPSELEGGTILVARGIYPTIDEQREDDEIFKKNTMGKTKEMLNQERKQAKIDAQAKKDMEKEKQKKEKEALFKARCNPMSDPGYQVQPSAVTGVITEELRRYRMAWSFFDVFPLDRCADVIYGFMKPIITEDLMEKMHLECRKIVDEMMRLELKVFTKAQQMMFQRVGKVWPKRRPRKRVKPPKVVIPFEANEDMIKAIQPIFDLDIITKPTKRLDDIIGDISMRAYEANTTDPMATYPSPGYGDVKRRLVLSCVFGAGLDAQAPRNKAVMLLGLEHNGKSFLVDCVAGEMNAVKFDISPEVFSAKVEKIAKMMNLVFTAAKIFQPSVIFLKNIERVFYKKALDVAHRKLPLYSVRRGFWIQGWLQMRELLNGQQYTTPHMTVVVPAAEKHLKSKKMKGPLVKMIKALPVTEKVIFIATCSQPFLAKLNPMMKMFTETIIVPKPDYSTLQKYFYDKFLRIRSMPRDFNSSPLAKCMQGIGFGKIMEIFEEVMTPERICKLNHTPLNPAEFIDYMIVNNIESMDEQDYKKIVDLWLKYSPLKKEREEYNFINVKRADAYAKFEKMKADKEAKAAANKAK